VALVPLFLVLHEGSPGPAAGPAPRGVRWAPWITGILFYATLFRWIVRLPVHAMTHPWLIYPGLLALGLYLGLYVAVFGWMVRFARRRLGWPVLALAPAAWVVSEWAKSSGALGCPWGNLGYALAQHPAFTHMASLAGAQGVTFWIVLVNAVVTGIVVVKRWPNKAACAVVAALLVWLPVHWGNARLRAAHPRPLAQVALVQPNTSSEDKWNPAEQDSIVQSIYDLNGRAASTTPHPTLTIWPETALPFYVRLEPLKLRRLQDMVKSTGVPLLLGYPDARLSARGAAATFNAAGLLKTNGNFAGQYEKMHLVPFGERIPFQGLFPFLGKVDLGQAEWTPGSRIVVFTAAGPPFGVMICFESIFPDHARKIALEGADYLVNITNDEWFGKSAGPVQHADMAILRSVELGRSTARCANTGISMFIDPFGRVIQKTPLFEQAILTGTVDAPLPPTLYLQWGDWITVLSLGLTFALIVLSWFRPIQRLERPSG